MEENFDWLVIGAGVSGIAAVGKLLDAGVEPHRIGWIDPAFAVGDLGAKWQGVPSNTRVELFLRYLTACKSFDYRPSDGLFTHDPTQTCFLKDVVAPLQIVTDRLRKRVVSKEAMASSLQKEGDMWVVNQAILATKVIVAIGATPKQLNYPASVISLECALDCDRLIKEVREEEVIGVFGSSHSAVLVLANLMKSQAQRVYQFYRTPHRYAEYLDGWILYDDVGLKGFAASWAKENLDKTLPSKLCRVKLCDAAFEEKLQFCNRLIYAIGFERRALIDKEHCKETGRIAPNLYGCGIAFPMERIDPAGNSVVRVGLWKFMDDLSRLLPMWIQDPL